MSMQTTTVAGAATRAGGTSGARRLAPPTPPRRVRGFLAFVLVSVLTVGLGVMWTFVAQRELNTALLTENGQHLESAHKAFMYARKRVQTELQGHCRVMVEDPRLKATLATAGMDAATVSDILNDLTKLRGAGFLMVLSPDGKVFAEAGAPALRGLDLADSGVVKKALASPEAAVGSWVLGNKVMDLSTMTIRYGDALIAYLVVGQSVDETILRSVADQTGVHAASALATKVVATSATEPAVTRVLESVAASGAATSGHVLEQDGERYVTRVVELGETAQAHRLVLARPLGLSRPAFEQLHWMLFAPPLLVLIAVLFSMFGIRLFRRSP